MRKIRMTVSEKLFEKLSFLNGAFHHNKKNRDGNQADDSSTINDYRNANVYQPQPVVLQVPLLKDQTRLWFENQFPQPNQFETSLTLQEDRCELEARFVD